MPTLATAVDTGGPHVEAIAVGIRSFLVGASVFEAELVQKPTFVERLSPYAGCDEQDSGCTRPAEELRQVS